LCKTRDRFGLLWPGVRRATRESGPKMAGFAGLGTKGGLIAGGVAATAVVALGVGIGIYRADKNAAPVVGSAPQMGQAPDGVITAASVAPKSAPLAALQPADGKEAGKKADTLADRPAGKAARAVAAPHPVSAPAAGQGAGVRLGGGQDSTPTARSDPARAGTGTGAGKAVVASLGPENPPALRTTPSASPDVATTPKAADMARPAKAKQPAPSFDLVRVDKRGSAVVAGKAHPDSTVDVLLDGKVIATVTSDSRGGFVALFDVPASGTPRVITLNAYGADGQVTPSKAEVVVLSPEVMQAADGPGAKPAVSTSVTLPRVAGTIGSRGNSKTAATGSVAQTGAPTKTGPTSATTTGKFTPVAAAPSPSAGQRALAEPATTAKAAVTAQDSGATAAGTGAVARASSGAASSGATSSEGPSAAAVAAAGRAPALPRDNATKARAPAVIIASETGVRVMQPAPLSSEAPDVMANVSLDLISYDDQGEVVLSGRSTADRHVRVYVDDKPITTQPVGKDGTWQLKLPGVDPGRYTLRVDELDSSGKVVSRLETPFQKEKAEKVMRLASTTSTGSTPGSAPDSASSVRPRVQKVTIQRGNTLWAIAKQNYGKGVLYMQIFNANRQFIRDPDLIYPGQIFTIPK